jgi:hypothetical protein
MDSMERRILVHSARPHTRLKRRVLTFRAVDGSDPGVAVVDIRLPWAPEAVDQARAALAEVRGLRSAVEDRLGLLVSEVVGEAVRHAAGGANGLALRVMVNGTVRVELIDNGGRLDPNSGFGLRLLDHLADSWGAESSLVWFELTR